MPLQDNNDSSTENIATSTGSRDQKPNSETTIPNNDDAINEDEDWADENSSATRKQALP